MPLRLRPVLQPIIPPQSFIELVQRVVDVLLSQVVIVIFGRFVVGEERLGWGEWLGESPDLAAEEGELEVDYGGC